MPPSFSARCWSALKAKYPQLGDLGDLEPEMIIAGSLDAFQRCKPDSVNGIPPTLEQVRNYFIELGSSVNPHDFLDHYDMVGWKVGSAKDRMKDWKAACRLWHRRSTTPRQGPASLFALQAQLKTIETELNDIVYPAGSAFKVQPEGAKAERHQVLMAQRQAIKAKIDAFAVG